MNDPELQPFFDSLENAPIESFSTFFPKEDPDLCDIEFEEGITEIPANAFSECIQLHRVIFPQSLKRICANAFSECTSLTSVNFPAMLETIEGFAFKECSSLNNIVFPNSLQILGGGAFYGTAVKTLRIDSPLKVVPSHCFSASALEELIIEDGVLELGAYSFSSCHLTNVIIPASLKRVGTYAFGGNRKLRRAAFEGSTELDVEVFDGCCALENITLPTGIKVIPAGSFQDTGMKEINIPDSVESIEDDAFFKCNNLKKVKFGEKSALQKLGRAFYNTSINLLDLSSCQKLQIEDVEAFLQEIIAGGNGKIHKTNDSCIIALPRGLGTWNLTDRKNKIWAQI
jgi:hypothetical protein